MPLEMCLIKFYSLKIDRIDECKYNNIFDTTNKKDINNYIKVHLNRAFRENRTPNLIVRSDTLYSVEL